MPARLSRRTLAAAVVAVGVLGWVSWGIFRHTYPPHVERFHAVRREAAALHRELDAEPPGTPRYRELEARFHAAEAEGWEMIRQHPDLVHGWRDDRPGR